MIPTIHQILVNLLNGTFTKEQAEFYINENLRLERESTPPEAVEKNSGHTPNLIKTLRDEAKFHTDSVRYMLGRAAERIEELEQERDARRSQQLPKEKS